MGFPKNSKAKGREQSMKIRNARRWASPGRRRWVVACAAFAAAVAARQLLHPWLGQQLPAGFFIVATILVEFFSGLGPALLVALLSVPTLDFLFVPPYYDLASFDKRDLLVVMGFLMSAGVAVALIEWLRRVQYQAELLAEVARSRHDMLLRVDNERMLAEDTLKLTNRMLKSMTAERESLVFIGNRALNYEFVPDELRREATAHDDAHHARDFLSMLHPDDAARIRPQLEGTGPFVRGPRALRLRAKGGAFREIVCELDYFRATQGTFVVLKRVGAAPGAAQRHARPAHA